MIEAGVIGETKEKFFKNRRIQMPWLLSIILNASLWIFLILKIKPGADPIYLHYNIYFGVDLIGQWYRIFLLPALGLILYAINSALAVVLYTKSTLLAYLMMWLTLCFQLILFFASYLIVRQNV